MSSLLWRAPLALLALSMMSAAARSEAARSEIPADVVQTTNCYGTWDLESCVIAAGPRRSPHVIAVPAGSAEERAAMEARDRRWVERCRPTIRQDRYGMPRYSYASPGCAFGRLD
ncbi:MAG: hypothetical protein IT536_01660 [Hyphomicrobiales bacterium]|nr:hypothetical protein [Hyphomicrobiales bacterium]